MKKENANLETINPVKVQLIEQSSSFYKTNQIKNKQNLDVFINDPNPYIRAEVAEQGYGLDKLINDSDWYVRSIVAKHGYGLEKLINDPEPWVRKQVAKCGYGLNKLVDDKDGRVRIEVARQGYGLEKLINDKCISVRKTALQQQKSINSQTSTDEEKVEPTYNLSNESVTNNDQVSTDEKILELVNNQPAEENNPKCIDHQFTAESASELVYTLSFDEKLKLIETRQNLDQFIKDPDENIRNILVDINYKLYEFAFDQSVMIRLKIANKPACLNILINDPDPYIRATVASHGYGLDKLVNDPSPLVRVEVAKRKYNLNQLAKDSNPLVRAAAGISYTDPSWIVRRSLVNTHNVNNFINDPDPLIRRYAIAYINTINKNIINDPDPLVRAAVADRGYYLNTLIKDHDPLVRAAVAMQGYKLDVLIKDKNETVVNISTLYNNLMRTYNSLIINSKNINDKIGISQILSALKYFDLECINEYITRYPNLEIEKMYNLYTKAYSIYVDMIDSYIFK